MALGLNRLMTQDENLRLVADGVPPARAGAATIEDSGPAVAVLNFGSLSSAAQVFQLHQSFPGTRLVVLANRPTAAECNQMLSFGATACLVEGDPGPRRGQRDPPGLTGDARAARSAAAGGMNGLGLKGSELLTPREADVLELLQGGATNAQIAQALAIGLETVRTHARNIYRKLGISSRRELARIVGA